MMESWEQMGRLKKFMSISMKIQFHMILKKIEKHFSNPINVGNARFVQFTGQTKHGKML